MPGDLITRVLVCETPTGRLAMALSSDEASAWEQVRTLAEHVPGDGTWTVQQKVVREA